MDGIRCPGPLWRRSTVGASHPMTFAETSLSQPGWTPVRKGDAFDWIGDTPLSARPARRTSLFGSWLWTPAETKKARSSLLQVASSAEGRVRRLASGCRLGIEDPASCDAPGTRPGMSPAHSQAFGRLSGLLSGCPPTGTQPQARAKLGRRVDNRFRPRRKTFSRDRGKQFSLGRSSA